MTACLYCGNEAGDEGFHQRCVPTMPAVRVAAAHPPVGYTPRYDASLPPAKAPAGVPVMRVRVIDVEMSFASMVVFMFKWALASIPALFALLIFFALVGRIILEVAGAIARRSP